MYIKGCVRCINLVLILSLILMLFACSKNISGSWQDQYDLGQKYLQELDYEQALVAFTNAIKIDPNKGEAYIGRGDTYVSIARAAVADKLAEGGTYEDILSDDAIGEAFQNARDDYETSVSIMDLTEDLFDKLADVYMDQGDRNALSDLLQQGRDKLGEDKDLQRWENYLDTGINPSFEETGEQAAQQAGTGSSDVAAYVDMGLALCEELYEIEPVTSGEVAHFRDPARYYCISRNEYEKTLQPYKQALYELMGREDQNYIEYGEKLEDVLYILGDMDELHTLREELYNRTGEEKYSTARYEDGRYIYGGNGVVIQDDPSVSEKYEYTYSEDGRLLRADPLYTSEVNGTWAYAYDYDDEGKIIKVTTFVDNDIVFTDEYNYDGNNLTICTYGYDDGVHTTDYVISKFGGAVLMF